MYAIYDTVCKARLTYIDNGITTNISTNNTNTKN